MLVYIYINSENEVIRSTSVTGILYNKGIICCTVFEILSEKEAAVNDMDKLE